MSRRPYLLAIDVGGTKTELALAEGSAVPGILARRVYASQEYAGLAPIIAHFLKSRPAQKRGRIAAACIAVAGPVEGDSAETTNLAWKISARALREEFDFAAVDLVNDFAAASTGIARLETGDLEILQKGEPAARGPRAVVGAGTGLGVGLMTWCSGRYAVHASEAGHADFAPTGEIQDGLLAYLRRSYDRVSYERVLSGAGLVQVFEYLKETGIGTPSRALLAAMERQADKAAVISEFGLRQRDPLAVRALDVFVTVYGAFAGNVALAVLARGGVYIAGGIAPKIAAKLKDGTFIRAFNSKGRFADLLSTFPVQVVMNSSVGLYGALEVADRRARRILKRGRRG